ncbi:MAG: hypothetical protein EVA29_00355 [Candidatus Actinomarinales bacterium]|nr:MAG: hypothetical protein EVA29_00355 [Candidatus Actinomarinales bacterium]
MNKTIAIINDPNVTLGTLPSTIIMQNAWEADWSKFNHNDNYIILGGHMGAYEEEKYEYLKKEKEWIRNAVENNSKILGICLGSQLVADSLDGEAYLSDEIEFGFKKLNFISKDEKFSDFEDSVVFTWHRDTFKIPSEAQLIAHTDFPQIYTIKNTVCIQFHPEVTVELFDKWYDSEISKKELKNYDVELTRNKLINHEKLMYQKVNSFYKKWLDS